MARKSSNTRRRHRKSTAEVPREVHLPELPRKYTLMMTMKMMILTRDKEVSKEQLGAPDFSKKVLKR